AGGTPGRGLSGTAGTANAGIRAQLQKLQPGIQTGGPIAMTTFCRRALLLLGLFASQMLYGQQGLTITITQGVDNPVPIAIVPFDWQGFGVLPESLSDIVNSDLRNSGQFAPIE